MGLEFKVLGMRAARVQRIRSKTRPAAPSEDKFPTASGLCACRGSDLVYSVEGLGCRFKVMRVAYRVWVLELPRFN